jgi:uncharacterized membrane protein YccC
MVIPLQIWGYVLRMWLAAVIAPYVASWLQLGGAYSAAATVTILAQPTRGAAPAKAVNRIGRRVPTPKHHHGIFDQLSSRLG